MSHALVAPLLEGGGGIQTASVSQLATENNRAMNTNIHPSTCHGATTRSMTTDLAALLATTCLASMSAAHLNDADNNTSEPCMTATTLQATTNNVDFEGTQLGHLPTGGTDGAGRTTRTGKLQTGLSFKLPGVNPVTRKFQHHKAAGQETIGKRMRKAEPGGGPALGNDVTCWPLLG